MAETTSKTIGVTLAVSLVSSILVATAAVKLKPIQEANKELDKKKNVLVAGGLLAKGIDVNKVFAEKIKEQTIDLKSGKINDKIDPQKLNVRKAATEPASSMALGKKQDVAKIRRVAKNQVVYFVTDGDSYKKVILPIYGKGLWSTMYGFLALNKDLKTIEAITFYEHGETPGLGGEVDNPKWKKIWEGKKAFDDKGNVAIQVIKGAVDTTRPDAKFKVDGLSGATLTTIGVDHTVKFWLGSSGYGPFLAQLAQEQSGSKGDK